jgi:AcrR family transcriptional regulator
MGRPARFSDTQILDATAGLVADAGPGGATIAAICAVLGAPAGSIYHRFTSRDVLLGRLWLRKAALFQDNFVAALANPDPVAAGLQAALSLPRTARVDFPAARIMLLHRREDFLADGWPPELQAQARRLKQQVDDALNQFARRLFGRASAGALRATSFAVLDVAFAAVRRHVAANEPPPPAVDRLIETAYLAVINAERESHDRANSGTRQRPQGDKQ